MLIVMAQERMKNNLHCQKTIIWFQLSNEYFEQNKVVLFLLISIMYLRCFSQTTWVKNENAFIGACICTSNLSFPKVRDNGC